jgi:nitrogen fixation/metabolism regulation signal transduction histidine kinase
VRTGLGFALRTKILLYLISIHLILGGVAFFVVIENRRVLLIVEALLLVSVIVGYYLIRALFVPLDLIRTGADLITERDFTSHFREVGQPEMDDLIRVYNRMIDRLREERLKLEEQNLFIDKVVQASPAGIVILDFDGNVEQANPRAQELLDDSFLARLRTVASGATDILTPDGRRRFRVHRGSFLDRGFTREFFLIEELTEELRASEKAAYEQLIRMMSHEVNNSVGSVQSLLDSCRNYASQLRPEDRTDFEQALSVSIARMSNLNSFTNSFADVVRIPQPQRSEFDLRQLVDDLVFLMQPELERRSIRIELSGAGTMVADKNQMEQVVVNLLRNAAEAIERDGVITVTVSGDGLVVADTGPGISSELEGKMFTPFFSTKRDGRGIGLTVINEILTNHGFEFALRSREGGGAAFTIRS